VGAGLTGGNVSGRDGVSPVTVRVDATGLGFYLEPPPRLSGTKQGSLISKGFIQLGMVHEFSENRTHILLKSLAIPAEEPFSKEINGVAVSKGHNSTL